MIYILLLLHFIDYSTIQIIYNKFICKSRRTRYGKLNLNYTIIKTVKYINHSFRL